MLLHRFYYFPLSLSLSRLNAIFRGARSDSEETVAGWAYLYDGNRTTAGAHTAEIQSSSDVRSTSISQTQSAHDTQRFQSGIKTTTVHLPLGTTCYLAHALWHRKRLQGARNPFFNRGESRSKINRVTRYVDFHPTPLNRADC